MKQKSLERPSPARNSLRGKSAAVLALLATWFCSTPLSAQDFASDRFTFRGFGTIGATTHDADGIEFRRTNGQAQGTKADDLDLGVDSIAGAQIDVRLGSSFDVVVQGVTKQRSDGGWSPRISQGFLRYSPDESLVLRAGRIGYDIYLLAESRQVGYSYLPVRPSPEFYGQITNDDIDGADVAYTRRLGPGLFRARLFGGGSNGELAFEYGVQKDATQDIYGGTLDYIHHGWTWRIAAVQFYYDAGEDIPMLIAGLRSTGFAGALAVADDLDHDRYLSQGVQLGMAYDDGPMLAQILYGLVGSDSIVGPQFRKIYGLFGYRLGNWTPYLSHVRSEDRDAVHDAGLPDIPQLAPLNAAVTQIQEATRSTQYTTTLGVRYDLSSHIAFKFQVDHTKVRDTSLYLDYRSNAGTPYDMTVLAASVDFVF